MILRSILLILLASLAFPANAAEWLRAETENYVIHARLDEAEMRAVAQRAEEFNRVLHRVLPAQTRPGRKLQLYLEGDETRISSISDFRNIGWVGIWPETATSFSVYDPAEDELTRSHTLYHALAGNHVENGFIRPTPPWVAVGVRLFFATAYVSEDGYFILGAPDLKRPMSGSMDTAKLDLILSAESSPRTEHAWKDFSGWSREAIFPMLIEPDNAGKLERYLNAYGEGRSLEDAANELGDLGDWAKQVRARQTTRRPTFRRVALEPRAPASVEIRPMRDDEIALIVLRHERLRRDRVEDASRKLANLSEDYPDSALVWAEYAAAEFARVRDVEFGGQVFRGFGFSNGEIIVTAESYSDATAWRAVNRALELDPQLAQALELKAEIEMNRLVRTGDLDDAAAFEDIRRPIAALAADAEQNPLAAALYHQSYVEQGIAPPQQAVEQLGRAFVANPGVDAFRYAYAVALSRSGHRDAAELLLTSMLNHPDYRSAAQRAMGEAN